MAKFIPSIPDPDTDNHEMEVRNEFKKLSDDWTIIHRQRVVKGRSEKEIDFVVLNPAYGWICFEVKGGSISRTENIWKQNSMEIEDPIKKLQKARSTMQKILTEKGHPLAPFQSWGLIFPTMNSVNINFGADLPHERVLFGDRLPYAEEIFIALLKEFKNIPLFNNSDIEKFIEIIAPNFDLTPTLRDKFKRENKVFIKLTEEQKNILDSFEEQRKVLIQGRAGTGKTILALEVARRRIEENKKVLYLCYNRPLSDEIQNVASDGIDVFNFHELCRYFVNKSGGSWKVPSFEQNKFFDITAPNMLLDSINKIPDKRWDLILVDEAQDFKKDWWIPIFDLLKHKSKSALWAFTDPLQNVYGLSNYLEDFDMRPSNLKRNCRNTKVIAEYSYNFVDQKPEMFNTSPEGDKIYIKRVQSSDEQMSALDNILTKLIKAEKIDPEDIAILSGLSESKNNIWKNRKQLSFKITKSSKRNGEIYFSTIKKFKGLDKDVVILADISRSLDSKDMYTGCSRAKNKLYIIELSSN